MLALDIALLALDKLHPFTYSLTIEMLPDVEERKELNTDLGLALERGDISVSDKIDVNNITNLKLASAVLKRRIKNNKEEAQQMQLQQIQAQQVAQQEKTQIDAQMKQMEFQQEQCQIQVILKILLATIQLLDLVLHIT